MRRSEINALIRSAQSCFQSHGWALPPQPQWDVTDFGLGDWRAFGLVVVNLAEEPEYCEKLMYEREGMTTPAHCHRRKKEDIIARWGRLAVQVWAGLPEQGAGAKLTLSINGRPKLIVSGEIIELQPGWRVTLPQGVYHEFKPTTAECIIGEVSTANDDVHDNYFVNPIVGRFPEIQEDEPPVVQLVSDRVY